MDQDGLKMSRESISLITIRDRIRGVAEAWREQYYNSHGGTVEVWDTLFVGEQRDREATHQELLALNTETATEDDVERIIGNRTWTTLTCSICGERVPVIVRFGVEGEYGCAEVCKECVVHMSALFRR